MNLLQKVALAVRAALSGPPRAIAPGSQREAADQQRELAQRRAELAEARRGLTEELARLDAFADAAVKAGNDAAARERLRQVAQTREALAGNARMTESVEQAERDIRTQMQAVDRAAERTQQAAAAVDARHDAPSAPGDPPPAPVEDDKSLKARMDRLRGPG